jgi:hypothetical protein
VPSRISNWHRQWQGLHRWEKDLLPRLVTRLLATVLLLKYRSAGPLIEEYRHGPRPGTLTPLPADIDESEFCIRCEHLVSIAAFHGLCRPACLPRALVLHRLLQGYGINSILQIGVQPGAAGQLQAHAWVEYDGAVLGDHPAGFAAFTQLTTRPSGSARL